MPTLVLDDSDLAVIAMSLLITQRLLLKSSYDLETQDVISQRIDWLLQYMQRRRTYEE